MFKIGDRVRVKSLGVQDANNGVVIGATGIIRDIQPHSDFYYGDAIGVEFARPGAVYGIVPGVVNGRWIGSDHLELVAAEPVRKGFQVGDEVIVVRGRDQDEANDFDQLGLLGRFGVIAPEDTGKIDYNDEGFKYIVKFQDWGEGWGSGCDYWGFDSTVSLRRVVHKGQVG
jgi:hypothetical protein